MPSREIDVRLLFDAHDPDEQHSTGYYVTIADYNKIVAYVAALEARPYPMMRRRRTAQSISQRR